MDERSVSAFYIRIHVCVFLQKEVFTSSNEKRKGLLCLFIAKFAFLRQFKEQRKVQMIREPVGFLANVLLALLSIILNKYTFGFCLGGKITP